MLSVSMQSNFRIKKSAEKWLRWVLVPVFILTAIALRFAGLDFRSWDIHDYLLDWYNELASHGYMVLREPFSNYTPPYTYLLYVMTKTAGFIPKIAAIKLISIGFDFLNAFLIYKILKVRDPQGTLAWIGASSFLLLPTMWMNSAYWGQSDAIYTCFLLACMFFLMKDQPLMAMIFFGFSFSFKAQAVFLGPFILLLIIKKKIPWHYVGMVPLIYLLMIIPAAVIGRPLNDLLTIYVRQADTYPELSMHAPNLYVFVPDIFFRSGLVIGLVITIVIIATWITVYVVKIRKFTPSTILLSAFVSVAFMPFFLPKMHDRYFYLAEVLSFLTAFYFLQGWQLTMGYQIVSGIVYLVFLHSSLVRTRIDTPFDVRLVMLAAIMNTVLMGFVFWKQWKLIQSEQENYLGLDR